MGKRICSIPGCTKPVNNQRTGWCSGHSHRWFRYGDPEGRPPPRTRQRAEDRFWSKVQITDTCWLWTGGLSDTGYGSFTGDDEKKSNAHRFAYELLIGPIPIGHHLHHTCHNRACVCPDHLVPLSSLEHGRVHQLPTCRQGHLLSEDNLYIRKDTGHRVCLTCRTRHNRKAKAKLKKQRAQRRGLRTSEESN